MSFFAKISKLVSGKGDVLEVFFMILSQELCRVQKRSEEVAVADGVGKLAAWFVLDPVVPDSNTIMSNNK